MGGFFIGAGHLLFSGNKRFILRQMEVQSSGYWNGRCGELAQLLGIRVGSDNLFALDLAELRARVLALPGVDRCEVTRTLPDSLRFRIIERIPRARISRHPDFLLDAEARVLERQRTMEFSQPLPLITGLPAGVRPEAGKICPEAVPAVALLMQTVRNFPDLEIIAIDVSDPEKLVFFLTYEHQKPRRVTMPSAPGNQEYLLQYLRTVVISDEQNNREPRPLDMRFDGKVICQ